MTKDQWLDHAKSYVEYATPIFASGAPLPRGFIDRKEALLNAFADIPSPWEQICTLADFSKTATNLNDMQTILALVSELLTEFSEAIEATEPKTAGRGKPS